MEKEAEITWNNIQCVQNILFPINNGKKIFIYPPSLINKLPDKVIKIIQPSQKYIPSFHITTLINAKFIDPETRN